MLKIQKIGWLLGLILIISFLGKAWGGDGTGKVTNIEVGDDNGSAVVRFSTDDSYNSSVGCDAAGKWVLDLQAHPAAQEIWSFLLSATFTGITVQVTGDGNCTADDREIVQWVGLSPDQSETAATSTTTTTASTTSTTTTTTTTTTTLPDPVAHYKFDVENNLGLDSVSGSGGSVNNVGYTPSGKVQGAASFNGSDARIELSDSPVWAFGSSDFSISLWVWYNTPGSASSLISQGPSSSSYFLILNDSNGPKMRVDAVGGYWDLFHPNSASQNTWYHYVFRRSGSSYEFYIDGAQVVQFESGAYSFPDYAAPVRLGALNVGPAGYHNFHNGLLDDIRVYNQALSEEQICTLAEKTWSADTCQ